MRWIYNRIPDPWLMEMLLFAWIFGRDQRLEKLEILDNRSGSFIFIFDSTTLECFFFPLVIRLALDKKSTT
jgi:hypothetical protein